MKKWLWFCIFVLLGFNFSCEKNVTADPKEFSLEMNRTLCYGTCPVYNLTVATDGKVVFVGEKFTKTIGNAEGQINPEKIKQLIAEINQSKFFSFKDDYGYESKNCSSTSTDSPSVTLKIKFDGIEKTIKHYQGCFVNETFSQSNGLKPLTDLENKIDEIVGTKQWIGK